MLELGEFTYLACFHTATSEADVLRSATTLWLFRPGKVHFPMCIAFLLLLINTITVQTTQAGRVHNLALGEQVCDRMGSSPVLRALLLGPQLQRRVMESLVLY